MWKTTIVITLLAALGLALYLPLSSPQGIFNTPDENANYFFAQKFSFSNGLRVFEPLADELDNAIHPRGVNVIRDFLVPESFLGLPILYGTLLELTKWAWILLVLVSVLTVFAIYALYQLFLYFFERKTARLSILLVLTLPAFLYWTGRPYMHTILFLDFLILGWWLMSRVSTRWDVVAGILLGLALAMRTSEVVWVVVGTLLIILPFRLREGTTLSVFPIKLIFGAALIVISLLFINKDIYGNFFGTGYSISETSLVVEGGQVPQLARVSFIEQLLLPFGFHPLQATGRFLKYALGGMWWYTGPMLLGVVLGLWVAKPVSSKGGGDETEKLNPYEQRNRHRKTTPPFWYTLVWLLLSAYLVLIYGSFRAEVFADPLHPLTATIGAPYLRYWLPIFVFGAPMVAKFFMFLSSVILRSRQATKDPVHKITGSFASLRMTALAVGIVLMVFFGARTVIWAGPESWQGIQGNLWQFAEFRERVERTTAENAVFIAPRFADRIYFPARRVIVDVEGKDIVQIVRALHNEQVPVFWHRGRGEIKLEQSLSPPARGGDEGVVGASKFKLKRRFDIDPKGKVYEIEMIR